MKKLFVLMAAAFAMVACQTDINEVGVVADGVATVEFEVGTPQMRAYSDGLTVDDLQYAVYEVKVEGENKTLTHLSSLNGTKELTGLSTNVQIELANNKKYAVIFWADDENAPYTFKPAEKTVTVDYNNAKCNDESRDAFYAYKEFEVKGAATLGVELRRPFAQVNVGTSDLAEAAKSNFVPSTSALVVKNVCNVLNLATGEATGGVDVTFKAEAIPTGEEFKVAGHDYLAMSYVLVGKDKGSYDVTYTITAGDNTVITNTIGAVPMQANYRTNIYGKLLTSTTDINVEIKPGYNEPANELSALQKAALNGGTVTLTEDVVLTTTLNVLAEMTIDLNGKTITGPSVATDADGNKIHSIINNGKLSIINGTITSDAVNGGSAIYTYGDLTLDNVTINGAPSNTATGTASYAVNAKGADAKVTVNNSTINGRGAVGVTNGAKAELNGGVYHTPAVAWGHAVYAVGEGTQVVINGGTFSEGYDYAADSWGMYQIYSGDKAQVIVNGGTFENWDCANGYDLCTASEGTITIYGGNFADNPASQNGKNFVAVGYKAVLVNGLYYVLPEAVADAAVAANVTSVTESTADVATALATDNGEATMFLWNDVAYIAKYGEVVITSSAEDATTVRGVVEYASGLTTATVAEGIEVVGNRTFRRCKELVSVELPSTLTEIASGAFQSCTKLTNITIPAGVTTIGDFAFGECSALTSINIPAGVTRIEANAFNASGLNSIVIPESVIYIGAQAFRDCKQLKEVKILAPEFTIEANAFGVMAGTLPGTTIYVANAEMKAYLESTLTYANQFKIVVPSTVSTAEELKEAITNGKEAIYVSGQIDLTEEILANYNGTIIGADDTACINTRTFVVNYADEAYHLSNKTINFKNITIKVPTEDGDFLKTGFVAAGTMNFDHCVLEGQVTLNGSATWTFDDCEFGGADSGAYASFVYGAKKVTFNRCSFSGVDRAAKVYGTGGAIDVEYNNCTFTSTTSNKYAVNIDASYATTKVALNGCSQTGMPGLYLVAGAKATVYVDGEQQ